MTFPAEIRGNSKSSRIGTDMSNRIARWLAKAETNQPVTPLACSNETVGAEGRLSQDGLTAS